MEDPKNGDVGSTANGETQNGEPADSDGLEQSFTAAQRAARTTPDSEHAWDHLEELAAELQRPDEVATLYREVLEGSLASELRRPLAERAVQFHEEWFGDSSTTMTNLVTRIIELDPDADWAFERLTVMLTANERWDELLSLYDRTLAATDDDGKRRRLLDDAAQLARDFADQPDRAADYMQQLLRLDPSNGQLANSLERLLERQERWKDLIELWSSRLPELSAKDARIARIRIAKCWLERLQQPDHALEQLRVLLGESPGHIEACNQLERVLEFESSSIDVRRSALSLLRKNYLVAERREDVVRVLEGALNFLEPEEQRALHRECGNRLAILGRDTEAIAHYAALLEGDPTDTDARKQLRQLANRSGRNDLRAQALRSAADACTDTDQKVAVLLEAADLHRTALEDSTAAVQLYRQVLDESDAEPSVALSAAHHLNELLAASGRDEERLAVLERLAELERSSAVRRFVLGEAARLAENLKQPDRALANWQPILEVDEHDLEALSAVATVLERNDRWEDLVDALQRRSAAPVLPQQRRADLCRIAEVQATKLDKIDEAISTWLQIRSEFGEDDETVAALDLLMSEAERYAELADLLDGAASRQRTEVGKLLSRLGDILRNQLTKNELATRWYTRALGVAPTNEAARTGLTALLEDGECTAVAADALARAYRITDDWQQTLQLLEHRLDYAGSPARQVELLRQAAELHSQRAQDPNAALEVLARALPLDPANLALEQQLLALAEATDGWTDAARALREAGTGDDTEAMTERSARCAQLRLREGGIHEGKLANPVGALSAYQAAIRFEPTNVEVLDSVARCGAQLGRWTLATNATVAAIVLRDRIEDAALATLEEHANADAYSELAAAMTAAVLKMSGLASTDATEQSDDEGASEDEQVAQGPTERGMTLQGKLAQKLLLHVAHWQRDQCEDLDAAEQCTQTAIQIDDTSLEALELLAELRRRSPDTNLIDTLLRIDELSSQSLDSLYEAAKLALDIATDGRATQTILEKLYRKAGTMWTTEGPPSGTETPESIAVWALDRLVGYHVLSGNAGRAVHVLNDGAKLPIDPEKVQQLRRRAAEMLVDQGEPNRAIEIYQALLQTTGDDLDGIRRCAQLCEQQERINEALTLRLRELELTADPASRLQLRLENARLTGLLEERGGRVRSLLTNLEEQPGHEQSIEALCHILVERGRYQQLVDVLGQQADQLEQRGQTAQAAGLWNRVASSSEQNLNNVGLAIAAHTRVVELENRPESLDALARLHLGREEPADAAAWFEKRLAMAGADERVALLLSLARARIQAEQQDKAIVSLASAFAEAPRNAEVRKLLLRLYRANKDWESLARTLTTAVDHITNEARVMAYAREAADIYHERLATPERAVPVLQKAVELAPEDRKLKTMLAESLRAAGQLEQARDLLAGLIEEFGRRRSAERAGIHLQLARVTHALGETADAIDHLDAASKMDSGNVTIQRTLAELAREDGQLDRAERAYRTLLLTARRAKADQAPEIGPGEILLELSRIAAERGQADKGDELAESVLDAVAKNDSDAARVQRKLAEYEAYDLLLRVLDTRLSGMQAPHQRAEILDQRAEVLETALDRADEALVARLDAIKCDPGSPLHHQGTRDLALRTGQLERYVEQVESLFADARDTDLHVRCELLLRLGEVAEKDRQDLDRATEHYAQAEATGVRQVDVWRAQAGIAAARGDDAEQLRLLNQMARFGEDQTETRADALYRIAEVQLASPGTLEDGVASLRDALMADLRAERAGVILRRATETHGNNEQLLDLYEQVARKANDKRLLLHYLEHRAASPEATPEVAREATHLALELEETERAEALMLKAAEIGRAGGSEGLSKVGWALLGLAERRKDADDIAGAVQWLSEASEVAPAAKVFALGREVAELAAGPEGDLTLAAKLYERLLERDATAREVWQPLTEIYRKLGDIDRLERVVDETLDGLQDPADRNGLRVELARALLDTPTRTEDAIEVLQRVLADDPTHEQAQELLIDHLDRAGKVDELLALLRQQLDAAGQRGDTEATKTTALKLGQLLGEDQQAEALEIFRSALSAGDDADLLRAMLERLGPECDPQEQVQLYERLLVLEQGLSVGPLALELAEQYAQLQDQEGELRALSLGYQRCPESETLRERLEQVYREKGDYTGLAQTLVEAADRSDDLSSKVALWREAAGVFRDQLAESGQAARLYKLACEARPDDITLRIEFAATLGLAGHHETALDTITDGLDLAEQGADRLQLLKARADLRANTDDHDGVLVDLEEAFSIDGEQIAPTLETALEQQRSRAVERGDREIERSATLRSVEVMLLQDKREQASDILTEWVAVAEDDIEALRRLRDLDTEDGRWEKVAAACERLLDLESGTAQVDAALSLSHACRELGTPEQARPGLEKARSAQPDSPQLCNELRKIYEQIGANHELAMLMLDEARGLEDDGERAATLHEAGKVLVQLEDAVAAIPALREALELQPGSGAITASLADAYIISGFFDDAASLLNEAIDAGKGRRTPEMCLLQHRRAELARAQSDSDGQLAALQEAHLCNKKNGYVAAELADLAEELENWELASKTLRTISLVDTECPIDRAQAFFRQGKIAYRQGDAKSAAMWARRARREDHDSQDIEDFLNELGAGTPSMRPGRR